MRASRAKRGFTLAELIMAVALLAVFSTFIVQMFVKADTLAKNARVLDQAVAYTSNLADQWRTGPDGQDLPELVDLSRNPTDGRSVTLPLDAHFQPSSAGQAHYLAVMTIKSMAAESADPAEGTLWQLTIVVGSARSDDRPPIYSLKTSRYDPAGEAGP